MSRPFLGVGLVGILALACMFEPQSPTFHAHQTATEEALAALKGTATAGTVIDESVDEPDTSSGPPIVVESGECAGLTQQECVNLGEHQYSQAFHEYGACIGNSDDSGPRDDASFSIAFEGGNALLASPEFGWLQTFERVKPNTYTLDTTTEDGTPNLHLTLTFTGNGFNVESRFIADNSPCLLWERTFAD